MKFAKCSDVLLDWLGECLDADICVREMLILRTDKIETNRIKVYSQNL